MDNKAKEDRTHAADKLFGYTLQVKQMLYELVTSDVNNVISIENLDDVATQTEKEVKVIQIKSSSSENNPISNSAKDFWKTFYNWVIYVKQGKIVPNNTKFKLLIYSNNIKVLGSVCQEFDKATNKSDANVALGNAKVKKSENKNKEIEEYLDVIFDENNREIVENIIVNFNVETQLNNNFDKELLEKLQHRIVLDEYLEVILRNLLGWVHKEIEKYTRYGKPAFISGLMFEKELKSQLKIYRPNTNLHSFSDEIANKEAEKEVKKEKNYIRQLDLIKVEDEEKINAAKAFLRNSIDKTKWADNGIITSKGFEEYQKGLIESWKNKRNMQKTDQECNSALTDEIIGKKIYFSCVEDNKILKLQGSDLPYYFCKGEYSHLANDLLVGWHLKYNELLKNGEDDE